MTATRTLQIRIFKSKIKTVALHALHVRFSFCIHYTTVLAPSTKSNDLCVGDVRVFCSFALFIRKQF